MGLVRGSEPTMRHLLLDLTIPRTLVEDGDSEPAPGSANCGPPACGTWGVPKAAHNVMVDNPAGFVAALRA